jgi:putative tributyrin esterase
MKSIKSLLAPILFCAVLFVFPARALAQQPAQPPTAQPSANQEQNDLHLQYGSLQSSALGRELKFAIQLPASYDTDKSRRYPVLYFLHGMNGNEREFERRGVAAAIGRLRTAGAIGDLIIVAPAGENSFYLNSKPGVRYEDAIIQDLIPYIEKNYRAIGTPAARAIQGISMGGFGALMLALKHPEMFSSVSTHSAALFAELPKPTGEDRRGQFMLRLIGKIFGDPPDDTFFQASNPMHIAQTNTAAIKRSGIKIYFDVGDQDRYGFQNSNREMDEILTKIGIAHEFHVFPGNHGWEYMISVVDRSYPFVWKNIKTDGKNGSAARSSH